MKPIKPLSLWLLILLALAGCAGLPSATEPPRVSLVDLRVLEMQLFEQRYELTLRIQNPGARALHISGMSFKLEINDRDFAQGVSRQALTVAGFGEQVIRVQVSSSLSDIINQWRDLQEHPHAGIRYRIHGRLQQPGAASAIPFEYKGEIGGGS